MTWSPSAAKRILTMLAADDCDRAHAARVGLELHGGVNVVASSKAAFVAFMRSIGEPVPQWLEEVEER